MFPNNKGRTLIEMLIVIAVIGIIAAVGYRFFFMADRNIKNELEASMERNEIRAATSFLKGDIRNSIEVERTIIEGPEKFISTIKYKSASPVVYTLAENSSGTWNLVRQENGQEIHFKEIDNAEIYDVTDSLVQVRLFVHLGKAGSPDPAEHLYEFKLARWSWQLAQKESGPAEDKDIFELIEEDEFFVIGAGFIMSGDQVNGEGASIYINEDLLSGNLNGGAEINVTNANINGKLQLEGSQSLGSQNTPGTIIVNGDVDLSGSAKIYGDLYLSGKLTLTGSARIYGNVYVQGDFDFNNGEIYGDFYIQGNMSMTNGLLDGQGYVNGNVSLGWTPRVLLGSKVYYYGTISHPATLDVSRFEQIASAVNVPARDLPPAGIPAPHPAQWYADKGYSLDGALDNDARIYVTSGSYLHALNGNYTNVLIVNLDQTDDNGNINIGNGNLNIEGVLYAPYGKITINGASFKGLAIAAQGVDMIRPGSTVTFAGIENYIANQGDYPFKNEILP